MSTQTGPKPRPQLVSAQLDPSGFIVAVPEPSTLVLGLLGGLVAAWVIRRYQGWEAR